MIIRIISRACLTTKEVRFLRSLDLLCTGKEATGGDASVEKRAVIGAAVELGGDAAEAGVSEEGLEEGFGFGRAGGTGGAEGGPVAVVDAVDVVWVRRSWSKLRLRRIWASSSSESCDT